MSRHFPDERRQRRDADRMLVPDPGTLQDDLVRGADTDALRAARHLGRKIAPNSKDPQRGSERILHPCRTVGNRLVSPSPAVISTANSVLSSSGSGVAVRQ